MLHHKPHSIDEAESMIDVTTEVRDDARDAGNDALVLSCDDELLELTALRIAMIPEPRDG